MTVQELINELEKVPNKNMEILNSDLYLNSQREKYIPFTRLSIEVNHRTGSRVLLENHSREIYEKIDFDSFSPVEEYVILYENFENGK